MYLKKLDIQGFKSFADKTSLKFSSGVTAIVGPNGSGKSNIADAVRWVLGEQSAKVLRGKKMEDVIFSGTEHRRPLGFSEVSLTIDNTDKRLPVDYDEVTITRRIFRSGESEYQINKTSCRLKDIHEMFFDTGIGKDGYSIIGQGRIDEILSTKSEDRRRIFEEASGIMKYKTRKYESEKKLEQTNQNLLRISDIIGELNLQLGPLEEQAENAKKFLILKEQLKVLEVNLYLLNISQYKEALNKIDKQLDDLNHSINENNDSLQKKQLTRRNMSERLTLLEQKLNITKENFHELESKIEKGNSQLKLNTEKINNNNENISRLMDEIKELESSDALLSNERNTKLGNIEYLESQYSKFAKKLEELQQKMDNLMSALNDSEKVLALKKQEMSESMDLLSDKRLQANNVKNHIHSIEERIISYEKDIFRIKLDIDKENILKDDICDNLEKTKRNIKDLQNQLHKHFSTKNIFTDNLEKKRILNNKILADIQVKTSRRNMLQDMEDKLEGYNRSVKSFLLAVEQNSELKKGIFGAVAQLISVEEKYQAAIELSLGGSLQQIVTDTEVEAKKAIAYLKANNMGRATFLPISTVKSRRISEIALSKIALSKGFIGIASDLISYDEKYDAIVNNLLGRVLIVDNIDNAINLAKQFNYSYRICTLEGDIINPTGSIAGGSKEHKGLSILGRQREIDDLDHLLKQLKNEETEIDKEISDILSNLQVINQQTNEFEKELKDNELVKMRDESHLTKINENLNNHRSRIEMIEQEISEMGRTKEETQQEFNKYETEIQELDKRVSTSKKEIDDYQNQYRESQTIRDELYADITDHRISVNSVKENIESVKDIISRIENDSLNTKKSIEKKLVDKEKFEQQNKALLDDNNRSKTMINKYEQEKTGKTFEIDKTAEEKDILAQDSEQLNEDISDVTEKIMILKEELNRIEIRKAKTESEMESIQNRLWDDYELTFINASEYKKDIGSIPSTQRQITALKEEIEVLGIVNVNAIDEYKKTKVRCEFMELQKNDMEKAILNLRKVITEMTNLMKKQFIEQFQIINSNFSEVFKELFDGGRASVVLEDIENVLESGIEIEVQPPGKKLQNMMLLSGGERALTAIALLFAILKLNPTPFCILDEIEAALDDTNIYKFGSFLGKFSNDIQFIMVTHRKGTMEISDMMYGVTMEEHGISKVVSMKLEEQEAS